MRKSYGKWIATCLVFFALPLLLTVYGLGAYFDGLDEQAFDKRFSLQDKLLLDVRRGEKTPEYLARLANQVVRMAEASTHPFDVLRKGILSLKRRFPGILHVYVTDHQGALVDSLTEPNTSRFVLKKLYQTLQVSLPDDQTEPLKKIWSTMRAFIGPDSSNEEMIANHRKFFEVNSTEAKRWFFFHVTSRFGVFMHANHSLKWTHLGIHDILARCRRLGKIADVEIGIKVPEQPLPHSPAGKAIAVFHQNAQGNQKLERELVSLSVLDSTAIIWAATPKDSVFNSQGMRIAVAATATVLFAVLCWFSFSVMQGYQVFFFSIRWRLMVLFFFASSLPLLVIFIAGWDYLNQKYRTEVRETFDRLERALRSVDQRFPFIRGTLEANINRLLGGERYTTAAERSRLQKKLETVAKTGMGTEFFLYDKKGDPVHTFAPGAGQKSLRGQKIMGKMIANAISTLNQEPVEKVDVSTSFLESVGGMKNPISLLIKNLGKVLDFSLADNNSWTYMKPFYGENQLVTHVLVVHWQKEKAERLFLEKRLPREERMLGGIKLLAAKWNQSWVIPESFPYLPQVKSGLRSLNLGKSMVTDRRVLGRKNLLILGIKPKEMLSGFLFGVISDQSIRERIRTLEGRLAAFGVIIGIISVFLGFVLSQKFLQPIGDLTQGVIAVQRKNFRHRVPRSENDELGELAGMFNNMIENLHEVSMATEVQTRLFPAGVLTIGEYRVHGKSRPATQLGGDYFDYVTIANRFLLVFIGDVTGHGVPAAIVMAMSKALLTECANGGADAQKTLETLNLILFQCMKKKLLMTAGAFWVDTVTHQASTFNCGHPFPFKRGVDGKCSMVEAIGSPLGTRAKMMAKANPLVLQPGERMFFYTDGLVESITIEDGRPHFDHFSEYIESRPLLPLETACDDLLDNHEHMKTGLPQPDDFTILIVERVPAADHPHPEKT